MSTNRKTHEEITPARRADFPPEAQREREHQVELVMEALEERVAPLLPIRR